MYRCLANDLYSFSANSQFLISSEPEKSVGRYDLKVVTYVSPKTGKLYIVETIFDTKTGEVISRTKFFYKNYNKKKKRKK